MATQFVHRGTVIEAGYFKDEEYEEPEWYSGLVMNVYDKTKYSVDVQVKWKYDGCVEDITLWAGDFDKESGLEPWRFENESHNILVHNTLHNIESLKDVIKNVARACDRTINPIIIEDEESLSDSEYKSDSSGDSDTDSHQSLEDAIDTTTADVDFNTNEHEFVPTPTFSTKTHGCHNSDESFITPLFIIATCSFLLTCLRIGEFCIKP